MGEPRASGEIYGFTFDECYHDLMFYLSRYPDYVCSPRGQKIKECLAQTLVLEDPRARLITNPARKADYGFASGEFIWYWQGRQDLEMMTYYNKRMKDFSDDGKNLTSAYGWRLCANVVGFDRRPPYVGRSAPSLTQWDVAKMTLAEDPDSRRAVLLINEPGDEVKAAVYGSKDVPCTLSLQFFIRENRLHLHVHMRSNDAVWGLTNDLFSFTLFQECMLLDLRETYPKFSKLELGTYYHTAGSLHIYERHFKMAEELLALYSSGWDSGKGPEHGMARGVSGALYEPMPALTSLSDLKWLCEAEEHLRRKHIGQIDLEKLKGGERWLAEQLNKHRQKRDAEETRNGEQKAE